MTSSAEIPALSNHSGHQLINLFVVTVAHFKSQVESNEEGSNFGAALSRHTTEGIFKKAALTLRNSAWVLLTSLRQKIYDGMPTICDCHP